jgi:hypothetical protein
MGEPQTEDDQIHDEGGNEQTMKTGVAFLGIGIDDGDGIGTDDPQEDEKEEEEGVIEEVGSCPLDVEIRGYDSVLCGLDVVEL